MRCCAVPRVVRFFPPDVRTGFRVFEDAHTIVPSRSSKDNVLFAVIYVCRIII